MGHTDRGEEVMNKESWNVSLGFFFVHVSYRETPQVMSYHQYTHLEKEIGCLITVSG